MKYRLQNLRFSAHWMARLGSALKVVLGNLALFLVLMELLANAAYFAETGRLYYLHKPVGRQVGVALESSVESYLIHPYYGYTLRPTASAAPPGSGDTAIRVNNFGFESARDYPVVREKPERFLVGIFGGSVAAKLAAFETQEGILAKKLATALKRRPEDIVILNFAQGGFKQPQQLLVLGHLLAIGQELDLVLEIDGFNDVALAGTNLRAGIVEGMPSVDHVRALQDVTSIADSPEAVEKLLDIRRHWVRYARTFNRAWGDKAWELRFASGFLADWMAYKFHLRRYHKSRLGYAESEAGDGSWLYLQQRKHKTVPLTLLPRIVKLWARSTQLMDGMQHGINGRYLHFVQPNQYYDTGRVYSDAEHQVAFAKHSGYAPFVQQGYPLLEIEASRLKAAGFPIWNLSRIFDEVPEPVYADDCCHYTDLGQKILAEQIGDIAARQISDHSAGIR